MYRVSVSEGPAGQKPAGQHDGVTVDDPLKPGQARVQACADVGQGDVDDGDVELHQKHSGTHRGQHDVALSTAVVGRFGVVSKGRGLSRHAVSSGHTSEAWWRITSPDDELTSAQTVGMSTSSPRTAATSRYGDADVASVAALIADPARGRILMALAGGRALPASVLATEAGISAQSASGHLKKLVTGNLLRVAATGRHRYYTLAGSEIAAALESLALIAEPYEITSLRQGTRANALLHPPQLPV